jgi:anti-anti-sigma factor
MNLRLVSDDGDVLRLEMVGQVVQSESVPRSELLSQLLGPPGYARNVVLSMAETHFIDSSGLSWLVVCHKRFCQAGGKLVVHSLAPPIIELLKLMRLDLALHVAQDEAAALEFVRENSS